MVEIEILRQKISHLVQYIEHKKSIGDYENNTQILKNAADRIIQKWNKKILIENKEDKPSSAYVEEKEKLFIRLHDGMSDNDAIYVCIHLLSLIGNPEVGHTKHFWKINKFLMSEAFKCDIYKPVNYKNEPFKYCGLTIDPPQDSIYDNS